MFIDVALPKGDEKEFVKQAKKLGTEGLIFLYEKLDKGVLDEVKSLETSKFKIYTALMSGSNPEKKKADYLFSTGARNHFESKRVDCIYEVEKGTKKDSYHYRHSGLNQVLAKLLFEKKINLCFSFNLVLTARNKPSVMGKMMQNAVLCNKYKCKSQAYSFARKPSQLRGRYDLESFGRVLGLK